MIGDWISTGTGGPEATECLGIACGSAAVEHNAVDRGASCIADTPKPVAAIAAAVAAGVEKAIVMRAHSHLAANMTMLRNLRHLSEQGCKQIRGCLSVRCACLDSLNDHRGM